ncbi:MAG: DUF1003 domain-containing protein [Massilia sp.]
MPDDSPSSAALPHTVSENISKIADFYAQHEQHLSFSQNVVEKISHVLGSPGYVAGNVVLVLVWIAANLAAPEFGWRQFDEPPFFWLQGIVGLNAFVISTTVLIRQNRMQKLAEHHAHLDLQVNLLTEEKSSKIIALLEQLRADLPNVTNHIDPDARELAKPADAKAVLDAIEHEQE